MPVNLHPEHKRRRHQTSDSIASHLPQSKVEEGGRLEQFGDETDEDKMKALAEAEWKNLWDATEVIDMDPF